MEFRFTPEEEKLVKEVHDFLEREVTPQLVAECFELGFIYGGPEGRKVIPKMGASGWLCPTWLKEYGGLESSEMVRFKIVDDMAYMGVPFHLMGAHMAGPTILRYGSEANKKRFLPPIARGEVEYALGYTEPQAGSDLASIEMRAEVKGDHFLLNGQKMFNTNCHVAEYHWLAVRTNSDPNIPKHRGISLMIVDMKSPGITIRPMITMAGWRTNEVFYDNVKVPKENLVGELDRGFYYIMAALDFERMSPVGLYRRLFEELMEYTKETKINGKPLSKNPVIRQKLAEVAIELEAAQLLYYRLAYLLDRGEVTNYQASMQKVFITESGQHLTNIGMQIMGYYGQLEQDSKWAPLQGKMQYFYRDSIVGTIYGGTSEIQRNVIALRGLGLPAR
jgi:alkylation response protein AidB-like acyl-CoA dehydrogenase